MCADPLQRLVVDMFVGNAFYAILGVYMSLVRDAEFAIIVHSLDHSQREFLRTQIRRLHAMTAGGPGAGLRPDPAQTAPHSLGSDPLPRFHQTLAAQKY